MASIGFFVAPVPTANKEAYLEHSRKAATVFKELGALEVVECWGTEIPDGEVTSFPLAVKLQEGETVVAGWIRWPSLEVATAAMSKMQSDPEIGAAMGDMPFDGKRLIFGDFEPILEV